MFENTLRFFFLFFKSDWISPGSDDSVTLCFADIVCWPHTATRPTFRKWLWCCLFAGWMTVLTFFLFVYLFCFPPSLRVADLWMVVTLRPPLPPAKHNLWCVFVSRTRSHFHSFLLSFSTPGLLAENSSRVCACAYARARPPSYRWCRTNGGHRRSPSWWCPPCGWQAPSPSRRKWSGARQRQLARPTAVGGTSTPRPAWRWRNAVGCPGRWLAPAPSPHKSTQQSFFVCLFCLQRHFE